MHGQNIFEDSTTYQWIMAQGEARGRLVEARSLVTDLGTDRFGPPPAAIQDALTAIADPERLKQLAKRTFDATSWDDLLATPLPQEPDEPFIITSTSGPSA